MEEQEKKDIEQKDIERKDLEKKENPDENSEGKQRKFTGWSKKGKILTGLGVGAAVVVLAVYIGGAVSYKDCFFKGIHIDGINCEKMSAKEAEKVVRAQREDYDLQLTFREDVTAQIAGEEIDYTYSSDGNVEKLLKAQNPFLWFTGYFKERKYNSNGSVTWDDQKLDEKLKALPSMQEDTQADPENAFVEFVDTEFVIHPEVLGTRIINAQMKTAVEEALRTETENLSAEEADVYVKPEITSENEDLNRELAQLNELACVRVTYQLPDGEEKVLDGETVRGWLDVDEEGNYSLDEEKITKKVKTYVKNLAEDVDTYGKKRTFHTTSGKDVTVTGNEYGWKINQKKERAKLLDNILNREIVERQPVYSREEFGGGNNGLGDTYIEVDMTKQHLYYYVDGNLELDSPVVTGTMVRSRYTPEGIFFLTFKERNRTLRGAIGADGQPSYQSFVNYWMPFNGGIGLHDATWRGSFGGTTYKYRGSHGCVNLPLSKAKEIYNMIDKETPIVCVYTDDYSLYG